MSALLNREPSAGFLQRNPALTCRMASGSHPSWNTYGSFHSVGGPKGFCALEIHSAGGPMCFLTQQSVWCCASGDRACCLCAGEPKVQRRVPTEKPCADTQLCPRLTFPLVSLRFRLEPLGNQRTTRRFPLETWGTRTGIIDFPTI